MSLSLTHSNHISLINVMKSTLHFLILVYLLLNLLLTGVKALPEVTSMTATTRLSPKTLTTNSDNGNDHILSLEKRSARYNFGIGKKSYIIDSIDEEAGNEDPNIEEGQDTKRTDRNRFAFGLGKRGEQRFAFGLGKKSELPNIDQLMEKRPNENRFQFGLGKRASKDNRFAFGLGKREHDVEEYIKRRYSFGLGKRSAPEPLQSYYLSGRL